MSCTRGLLQRMFTEGGVKQPIRKESNRRWVEGDHASLLSGDENEAIDSTGTVFKKDRGRGHQRSILPLETDLREWLKIVPLARIEKKHRLNRQVLRAGRDGKPVQSRIRKKLRNLYRSYVVQGVAL